MAFNINEFKNALGGGGARSSLFEVQLTFPKSLTTSVDGVSDLFAIELEPAERTLTFMCKTASIPSATVTTVDIPFMGRKVSCVGTRTFEPWAITIINDENFLVRKAFEVWMAAMNGHSTNMKGGSVSSSPISYQTDAVVKQFSQGVNQYKGKPLRVYKFINIFPTELSSIDLNWENENTVEEFSVTLKYDYWVGELGD